MTMNEKLAKRFQNTDSFHFHNANPKGKVTSDCVIRALATALEQPYEQTLRELTEMTIKYGYMLNDTKGIDKYLKIKGWVNCKSPRKKDSTKYTGDEFCKTLKHPIKSRELDITNGSFKTNRIIANIGAHHIVAIIDGQIWDTWNSSKGSIGKVWVKY